MRYVSAAFAQELARGNRNFEAWILIRLTDSTQVRGTSTTFDYDEGTETVEETTHLTSENILEGGLVIEDAVSNDDEFTFGTAIVNKCTVIINNLDGRYDGIDFMGAYVAPELRLRDEEGEYVGGNAVMGAYYVTDYESDEGRITLTCLDKLSKLDKPYIGHVAYPAELGAIILDCCTTCGLIPDSSVYTFSGHYYTVSKPPTADNLTHRQVVAWAAGMAGQFVRANSIGDVTVGFFDFASLKSFMDGSLDGGYFDDGTPTYTSGDEADGGSFNPWDTGYEADGNTDVPDIPIIPSIFTAKIAGSNVVPNGIGIVVDLGDTIPSWLDTYESTYTYDEGDYCQYNGEAYQCIYTISTPEAFNSAHWRKTTTVVAVAGGNGPQPYIITMAGNGLIDQESAEGTAELLYGDKGLEQHLIDFRPANITHLSDPRIEAGDVAVFYDRKGRKYPIIVSSTTFTLGGTQNTVSSATPRSALTVV